MRAILIDPETRTISEIAMKNPNKDFKEFSQIIGCDLVEFVDLDREITMLVDEEGRLKDFQGGFKFFGIDNLIITSKAVVIGYRREKFVKLEENIRTFQLIVEWVNKEDVPEPEFKFYTW